MKISELIERLGRTVFEAPFGATAQVMGESPEVAEIRIAVLDEVKKKIQRAGGQALFPYNVVRIQIRAAAEEGAVFERDFFRRFFDEEVRKGLSKEACRFPEDLRVEIRAAERSARSKWLRVETLAEDSRAAFRGSSARAKGGQACGGRREPPINPRFRCRKAAPISAGWATSTNPKASRGATIWRLPKTIPSIERCRASTPTLFTIRRPANIACSTIAGTSAATRPRTTAGCGSFATAWGRKCIATRAEHGCCPGDEIHLGKAVIKFQIK